jgi:hypothetical protein
MRTKQNRHTGSRRGSSGPTSPPTAPSSGAPVHRFPVGSRRSLDRLPLELGEVTALPMTVAVAAGLFYVLGGLRTW